MHKPVFRQRVLYVLQGALWLLFLLMAIFVMKVFFFPSKRTFITLNNEGKRSRPLPEAMPEPVIAAGEPGKPTNLYTSLQDTTQVTQSHPHPQRRVILVASALTLVALVAVSFLFSVRYYSGTLSSAGTKPAIAVQPQAVQGFDRGIIYPQWSQDGYGTLDTQWQENIGTMKTQTGAQWIEIPVLFSQAASNSTVVEISPSTPGQQSFAEGIEKAHELRYKVFFVPLMQVRQPGAWSGSITFTKSEQVQAWFNSYWNTLQPYIAIAAHEHVEQMAIGTELQTLQQIIPERFWNQLITRIRSIFKNTLTYDMNWSSLDQPLAGWLKNPALTYIGVSEYIPLLNSPARIDPKALPALWQQKIKPELDALATKLGKQILLTEIGYRNSSDALYHTWEATSKAPSDPTEQAAAFDAALSNVFHDSRIAGTFFWGWDDVGRFAIVGQPAVQVLLKWYSLPQA